MKRSTSLAAQTVAISVLLLVVAVGGTISIQTLPGSWFNAKNPSAIVLQQYNLTSIAREYSTILSDLGNREFSNVSVLLSRFAYANYPSSMLSAVSNANSEIATMNASIPSAANYLTQAFFLIENGEFGNTAPIRDGCGQIAVANNSLIQFANSTTPTLGSLRVPVSIYTPQLAMIKSDLDNLLSECILYTGFFQNFVLPNNTLGVNFTLSSSSYSVITGNNITVSGSLTVNRSGIFNPPITISFYMNGTLLAAVNSTGKFVENLNITSVYEPIVFVWAVTQFQTTKLFVAVSQKLTIHVYYNETQITLG